METAIHKPESAAQVAKVGFVSLKTKDGRQSLPPVKGKTVILLILLTILALLIHGYHVGVEDQEVYLAAIKKNLDPSTYPFNGTFFEEQMKAALFVPAVAATARALHSLEWALLLWHVLSLFGILLACWKLAAVCFELECGRWAALLLLTVLLTMPIAGTALYPVDQYLNPRGPATCGILLALAACLEKRWRRTAGWLLFAALMHPLMALFGISLVLFVIRPVNSVPFGIPGFFAFLPIGLLQPPSEAWNEAVRARTYCFPLMWAWYEWLGLIAPLALVWWFAHIAKKNRMSVLHHLATRVTAFALFQLAVALLILAFPGLRQLAAFQPMRWLHIFYFLFLLMGGGLAGQFLMRNRSWRWLILFVPLAIGMFYAQRSLFEHSNHIEWPGASLRNPWAKAFLWAKASTPKSAVFAIDPNYMALPAEEGYGFRALAERSLLAENQKDPGEVMVFPALATEWQRQVHAQRDIEHFSREQFQELKTRYDVSWAVLPATAQVKQDCPYRNEVVQICRVE